MKSKKNYVSILLLGVIVISFLMSVITHFDFFRRSYDYDFIAEIYGNSQYVKGEEATRGIGDDGLYAFAGYYYILGGDPAQVNFEHPPLGKYLIGLSVVLFNNESVIYLVYAIASLGVVYMMSMLIFKDTLYSLGAVALFAVSPFFKIQYIPTQADQLSVALLDLPLMIAFITGIYLFLIAEKKPYMYWVSSFFFGIAVSVKFFPALLLLLPVLFLYLVKSKNKLKVWIVTLVVIPVIYIASHAAYFFYHPSIIEFVRYQKWIISWRLGNPYVFGNIWRTIITGSYKNWWDGGVIIDNEWTLFFSAIVLSGLLGGIIAVLQKRRFLSLIFILSVVFLIYLSINTVGVARYVLPIYPLLTILSVNLLLTVFGIIQQWKKSISKQ